MRPGAGASAFASPAPRLVREEATSEAHYLHPGQVFASAESRSVATILGSCVAVCLWDETLRAGGMNHFVLAEAGAQEQSARFAAPAIGQLLRELTALGSRRQSLVAKVFGGACVLRAMAPGHHLGARNVEAAREVLRREGVRIVSEDVGGTRGRRVVFHTDDGSAWVRLL